MSKALMLFWGIELLIITAGCKSKMDIQDETIKTTLATYLRSGLLRTDSTAQIDSLRIITIDSVSSKDSFRAHLAKLSDSLNSLLFISKSKAKLLQLNISRYKIMKSLNSFSKEDPQMTLLKDSIDTERNSYQDILATGKVLQNEIDSLETILKSGDIDSTNFLYYGVLYYICTSNSQGRQKCIDSAYLTMTRDYKIRTH